MWKDLRSSLFAANVLKAINKLDFSKNIGE